MSFQIQNFDNLLKATKTYDVLDIPSHAAKMFSEYPQEVVVIEPDTYIHDVISSKVGNGHGKFFFNDCETIKPTPYSKYFYLSKK